MKHNQKQGFTLVELSIVLVIIGLIVGGVLVGQDLIKAAQIRSVVTQIQQYDAALNSFRTKYDGLPGDLTSASSFGLTAGTVQSGLLNNGRFDDNSGSTVQTGAQAFSGEISLVWAHMSDAALIPGSYAFLSTGTAAVDTNYPSNKLKKGGIVAVSDGSLNYWVVGVPSSISDLDADIDAPGLSPQEAFGIDSKLDDGKTNSGIAASFTLYDTGGFEGTGSEFGSTPLSACGTSNYLLATTGNVCNFAVRSAG